MREPHKNVINLEIELWSWHLIIYNDKIVSSFTAVDACVNEIIKRMSNVQELSDDELMFKTSFAIREILNNAVEHGNHFDESKDVDCYVVYDKPDLVIKIADEGEGFKINDSYYDALDNDKRERRRGLSLIEALNFQINIDKNTFELKMNVLEKG